MTEPESMSELIAREEAKRDRHITLEQRQAWEQSWLQQLAETLEYQEACSPRALKAKEAFLNKLHDPDGKLHGEHEALQNPR